MSTLRLSYNDLRWPQPKTYHVSSSSLEEDTDRRLHSTL